MELRRPESERSAEWLDRWQSGILRAADAVEVELAGGEIGFDLGAIGLISAFSYVTFRLPQIDWRAGRPQLTAWMAAMEARPSVAATAPPVG
jgi:glutathione S-transferase